jgi:DNA mismatch repair protein MutL
MPTIRQLPPNLINQIAAGEVIERPASVVKELLENSVDAGARRIEATIEKGGSELIRISDDGCGMSADQLPLAIQSHATSKLPDDDSLFHVQTLGFRGEALASIGSVCHLLIRSRPAATDGGETEGSEIEVRGGTIDGPNPCGCPVGTVMEIRNLFYNTPVRRKFLRTPQTEMGHIVEAFTRIALAHPEIHMTLRSGGRMLHDLPATTRWSERIAAFFGGEVSDTLIAVDSDDGQVRVSGYVCDPSVSRGNNRMQYLMLNGRHIRDRSLQHALTEAYRGLLMSGRFPVCFLRLQIPAEMVDVNVHPTKLEVRFADGGRIYARVLQTLRHKFLSSDLTMRIGPSGGGPSDARESGGGQTSAAPEHRDAIPGAGPADSPGSQLGMAPAIEAAQRQSVIQWARGESGQNVPPRIAATGGGIPQFRPFGSPADPRAVPGGTPAAGQLATDRQTDPRDIPPWEPTGSQSAQSTTGSPSDALDPGLSDRGDSHGNGSASNQTAAGNLRREDLAHATIAPPSHLGYQIHDRYLVTQDDRGMVVVDQHALHERILYERIREKVLGGSLETQRLLVPEPVSLTPAERQVAIDAAELLAKVGVEIEPFGGDSVLVRGYPAMLANMGPGEMLRQALESLLAAGRDPNIRDLLDHLLHTIACKAAIKAGDRLTAEEITSLLEQRDLYQDTHHCPHGRPTALFFSRDELDRMFGRLGPRGRQTPGAPA